MTDRWHWWEPRYELRLVRDDTKPGNDTKPGILVWTRHRLRLLAVHSRRLEEAHLRVAPARLVIVDRRSGREVGGRR